MKAKHSRTAPRWRAQSPARLDQARELPSAFAESATYRRAEALPEDSRDQILASIEAAFAELDQLERPSGPVRPVTPIRKGPPPLPAMPPPLPTLRANPAHMPPLPRVGNLPSAPSAEVRTGREAVTRKARRLPLYGAGLLSLIVVGAAAWLHVSQTSLLTLLHALGQALRH